MQVAHEQAAVVADDRKMVARQPERLAIVEQKVRRHRAWRLVAEGRAADHEGYRDVIPVRKLWAQRRCPRAHDHALDRNLIPEASALAKPLAALLLVAHDAVFRRRAGADSAERSTRAPGWVCG